MSPRQRASRTTVASVTEHHRGWLASVDTEGPFLAVPVLRRAWPQHMPALDDERKGLLVDGLRELERAWDALDRDPESDGTRTAYRAARDTWVETVLRDIVGWADLYVAGDRGLSASAPDRSVTVAPTGALVHGDTVGALVLVTDAGALRDAPGDGWTASPVDRMEELLRTAGVRVGVVTDGRWWGLVHVGAEGLPASGVVDAFTWVEEARARDAFVALLDRGRLVAGEEASRLPALFTESVAAAEDITVSLGVQVRRAVELLVAAFSEASEHAREHGRPDPVPDAEVAYDAAVTVMMRVVFLLYAEARGLLPDSELYTQGYAVSALHDELDARRRDREEALEATSDSWHRLLATSLLLHRGSTFDDMRLPAYGGSLFDPARFPFLTASGPGGLALTVSDRVMFHVLDAVQVVHVEGEARRLSFSEIDVEQIGYIYEGLLGYTARRMPEPYVGLIGARSAKRLEGEEPEIALTTLESYAAQHPSPATLAEAVLAFVKEDQPVAKPPTKNAIVKALATETDDAEPALRAVAPHDPELRDRLRPFLGIIRRDLRDRPVVVHAGGLLVVETPSRRNAGAHYTPRALAEEVVEHALAPLVYSPGPHETGDRHAWVLRTYTEILDLKVADIACGSGAFLVAAARYLGKRLLEAWQREGAIEHRPTHADEVRAIREVVAHCLYGADINAMAVEMCKLSLWLVSLDRDLPFSFVDDKILHGNSLLGLTDLRQLEELHIAPPPLPAKTGHQESWLFSAASGELVERLDISTRIADAIRLRQSLTEVIEPSSPMQRGSAMQRRLDQSHEVVAPLTHIADGVVAAGLALGGKPGKALDEAYENLRQAVAEAWPKDGPGDSTWLDVIIKDGLTPTVETDYERWQPLHWCLEVPDVMRRVGGRDGFDAIIGNPPFLGGKKVSGAMGSNLREWFVNELADGAKGNADLVAYFFLRAQSLLDKRGTLGLIATNTIAQGDTREVGLDRMVDAGFTITRAIQSRSWPAASANLEYAAVWGAVGSVAEDTPRVCDDLPVASISTLLEPEGRVSGHPLRLTENAGVPFIGCLVHGRGFVVTAKEAADWIRADPRNKDVLFPYLDGEDLNSRPDQSARRWVIDFNERDQAEASVYGLPYHRLLERAKPERLKYDAVKYPRMVQEWWKFWNSRPAMRKAIKDLDEVLVIARVSRTVVPARVSTRVVLHEKLVVFAESGYPTQASLSAAPHQLWAVRYGTTMRVDPTYSPGDVFETFPRPEQTPDLDRMGRVLDEERREIMLSRDLGLTKLYNLVNDPDLPDAANPAVARMRAIHRELDEVVMAAYGWSDVPLEHGFHTYRQMTRWTVSPAARVEILDRLLEENHRRAALQGAAPPPSEEGDADED